jgi:hypothetical protein
MDTNANGPYIIQFSHKYCLLFTLKCIFACNNLVEFFNYFVKIGGCDEHTFPFICKYISDFRCRVIRKNKVDITTYKVKPIILDEAYLLVQNISQQMQKILITEQ